jgi:riboflavin kinase/FMN adenylyltransferase
VRPTVDGATRLVEAHLLDVAPELYGRRLTLAFLDRIRPEQRFPSLDALRAQIAQDVATARRMLGQGSGPSGADPVPA